VIFLSATHDEHTFAGSAMPRHTSFRAAGPAGELVAEWRTLFAGLLICSQLCFVAFGQTCTGCTSTKGIVPTTPPVGREFSVAKEVYEVYVLFAAARNGKFISDLSENDITVLDDNQPPAAILGFRKQQELPLRAGLLIDTSTSVRPRFRFEQQGAASFLRQVVRRDGDQAFILGFSDNLELAQDFSNDPEVLAQGVQRLRIGGGTALYEAVATGCRKLLARREGGIVARVLVILSDGQNNSGTLGLEAAIETALEAQVSIYTISTNYRVGLEDWLGHEGNRNLRKLAEQTGGRMLAPPDAREVESAFEKIAEELRNRYAVAYRPANFKTDGHYRKIRIRARWQGRNLQIRARKGYYAKPASLAGNDAGRP
jgi:Ca-activated chloride channel family protein